MHTTTDDTAADRLVDLHDLMCPGCADAVSADGPAGADVDEFSHPDGSELCRDARGQKAEPVEVAR